MAICVQRVIAGYSEVVPEKCIVISGIRRGYTMGGGAIEQRDSAVFNHSMRLKRNRRLGLSVVVVSRLALTLKRRSLQIFFPLRINQINTPYRIIYSRIDESCANLPMVLSEWQYYPRCGARQLWHTTSGSVLRESALRVADCRRRTDNLCREESRREDRGNHGANRQMRDNWGAVIDVP